MSTWESIIAALASVGIKFGVLFSATIGGFLSLSFFEGAPQADGTVRPISTFQKWSVVGIGGTLGTYCSGPIIEISQIATTSDRFEMALGLVLGLFGMSLTAQIIKTIRELNVIELIKAWFPKPRG